MYASPKFVPRAEEFPSGPVSTDAALIMTAYVAPELTGRGLGRQLIQAAATDVRRKGLYALEAFGDARGEGEACVAPADFFRSVGFKTVTPDHGYPRLRLEMHSAIASDAEAANENDMESEFDLLLLDTGHIDMIREYESS